MRYRLASSAARQNAVTTACILGGLFFVAHLSAQPAQQHAQSYPAFRIVYYRQSRIPFAMDAPTFRNIFAAKTGGSGELQLTQDNHSFSPVLSPDGSKIAYIHIRSDTCEGCLLPAAYELYAMNVDGSMPHFIATLDGPLPWIRWSPDGKRISSSGWPNSASGSPLLVANVGGDSSPQVLAQNAAGFSKWSPDGKWIVYDCLALQSTSSSRLNVCIIDSEGRGEPKLLSEEYAFSGFSWSPDSSHLIFLSWKKKSHAIYSVGIDSSSPKLLPLASFALATPQWSSDGKQILFSDVEHGKEGIYIMKTDGSERRRLTGPKLESSDPLWSPDGKQIAFTAVVHGRSQVHLMNSDGSGLLQITHDKKKGCSVRAWLPNSRFLLLFCGDLKQDHTGMGSLELGHYTVLDRQGAGLQLCVLDLNNPDKAPLLLVKGFYGPISYAAVP